MQQGTSGPGAERPGVQLTYRVEGIVIFLLHCIGQDGCMLLEHKPVIPTIFVGVNPPVLP